MSDRELGGLLLTGGQSSRMGRDKAAIEVDGVTLAERTAALLIVAAAITLEVGPGWSSLESIREEPEGAGPLAAIVAGRRALLERGLPPDAACLVLACDLPLLSGAAVGRLASAQGEESVLPVIDGVAQPLCARWSATDLDAAEAAFNSGERSLRRLPDRSRALKLDESVWGPEARAFQDADTPEDLTSLGVSTKHAADRTVSTPPQTGDPGGSR
jgi:molybdopterin-guanine dinucleotide biosynthesis protein A